jgi:hypothetical protein
MGRDDGGDTLGQCEEQATQPLQFGETGGGGGGGAGRRGRERPSR